MWTRVYSNFALYFCTQKHHSLPVLRARYFQENHKVVGKLWNTRPTHLGPNTHLSPPPSPSRLPTHTCQVNLCRQIITEPSKLVFTVSVPQSPGLCVKARIVIALMLSSCVRTWAMIRSGVGLLWWTGQLCPNWFPHSLSLRSTMVSHELKPSVG